MVKADFLANNFSNKPIILESYILSPIYTTRIGRLLKLEIFKVNKNNSFNYGNTKNKLNCITGMCGKGNQLVSSPEWLGLFNPQVAECKQVWFLISQNIMTFIYSYVEVLKQSYVPWRRVRILTRGEITWYPFVSCIVNKFWTPFFFFYWNMP